MKKENIKKIVLAYSGGLDTSVIIPWLKENYNNPEIIAVSGNVGQADELEGLEEKALKSGASKLYVEDLTDEMVDDVIIPSLKMGASYEQYLLGTAFAEIQGIGTLPLGISFYTFQTLSYSIDVYRRDVKAERNIIDFGAYVVMFPQLIAGPIVRYVDVAAQIESRKSDPENVFRGVTRFCVGLGKKVLLADHVGQVAAQKSMELIEAKIRSLNPDNQPTVLTADFNKMLDSPIFDGVKKLMADARTTAPVTDNKASFNNFGGATNYPRIDHIFSSGFTPLRFATVDQRYEKVPYISDHYPIAAVLEFK